MATINLHYAFIDTLEGINGGSPSDYANTDTYEVEGSVVIDRDFLFNYVYDHVNTPAYALYSTENYFRDLGGINPVVDGTTVGSNDTVDYYCLCTFDSIYAFIIKAITVCGDDNLQYTFDGDSEVFETDVSDSMFSTTKLMEYQLTELGDIDEHFNDGTYKYGYTILYSSEDDMENGTNSLGSVASVGQINSSKHLYYAREYWSTGTIETPEDDPSSVITVKFIYLDKDSKTMLYPTVTTTITAGSSVSPTSDISFGKDYSFYGAFQDYAMSSSYTRQAITSDNTYIYYYYSYTGSYTTSSDDTGIPSGTVYYVKTKTIEKNSSKYATIESGDDCWIINNNLGTHLDGKVIINVAADIASDIIFYIATDDKEYEYTISYTTICYSIMGRSISKLSNGDSITIDSRKKTVTYTHDGTDYNALEALSASYDTSSVSDYVTSIKMARQWPVIYPGRNKLYLNDVDNFNIYVKYNIRCEGL